ncbi:hypothetical protein HPB51_010561 [Rhipicephalus microplus]|uniref:Uncharacterized protein n=1 Tax=Rhipicephalus microplus TaxID=6941 RepID=A0A9J6E7T4_RHIMP|nr:uncharacterized protein LOC119164507 isoform X2 [Rhipicephalus microplus]KAH8030627.1 hypothetical protein HPB51_010561 [Rhipicephalus microplus]
MAYLDLLCSQLSTVPQHELGYLDQEHFPNLPKLAEKPVSEAVSAVRAYLQSINDLRDRLERAAQIFSCLAVMNAVQPWALYHVERMRNQRDIVTGIMKKMWHRRVFGTYVKTTVSVCCSCVIVPTEERSRDYKPYFFVIWHSQPCIAIYEAPEGQSTLLKNALAQVLGSQPESFRCGVYQSLSSAYVAARQFFQ